MTNATDHIIEQTLALPQHVRAFLVERLIESLEVADTGTLSPAWRAEIRYRCQQIDQGDAMLRDGDAVFKDAFMALR